MSTTALSRRRALSGAATVGLAVPVLAACGDDGSGSAVDTSGASSAPPGDSTTSAAPETSAPAPEDAGGAGVATSDVPVGGGLVLAESSAVITQPSAGRFLAFSAICTHQGCLVSDVTETINCLCHNSTFAIDTGEATGGPATAPLTEMTVVVDGDRLVLS